MITANTPSLNAFIRSGVTVASLAIAALSQPSSNH